MQQETKLKLTTYGRVLKPLEIEDYERDVGAIAKVAIVPALLTGTRYIKTVF